MNCDYQTSYRYAEQEWSTKHINKLLEMSKNVIYCMLFFNNLLRYLCIDSLITKSIRAFLVEILPDFNLSGHCQINLMWKFLEA